MINSKIFSCAKVAYPSSKKFASYQMSFLKLSRSLSTEVQKKKVVIIGGGGFLGQYVAKAFVADPFTEVQMVTRSGKTSLGHLGKQLLNPAKGDVTNADDMFRACEGASVVINLVGIMHESKPTYTFDAVQNTGARNVAKAAQKNNAQLVHVSAIGADSTSDIPYAKTKGLGELAVRECSPDVIILRPSLVFGPEDDFFNRFSKLAHLLPVLPVFGGGHTKFQPVYVWDVARAVLLAVSGKHSGKTFELGGPNVYSYREMMQLLLSQAGLRRPIISLPWSVGMIQGFFLEKLPLNLFTLTRDQVRLLRHDNIVGSSSLGLSDLGISGTPAEKILHTYLRAKDLTTPNKRIHRMQSQDIDQELDSIRSMKAFSSPRPNAPNLEKQLEYHMDPPSRSNKS